MSSKFNGPDQNLSFQQLENENNDEAINSNDKS